MPTNEQRRAAAKRKLDRQLERREAKAKRQRTLAIGAAVLAVVVAAVASGTFWWLHREDNPGNSAEVDPATVAEATANAEPENAGTGSLPKFTPSANLGGNCQYPATVKESAAKANKPPRTGKVPTDPAQVSVSMSTTAGNVGLMLDNAKSPCTVNSFVSLAQQGYFDDTPCHRLTTSPSLSVLQCGDPGGTGSGGPGYKFGNEYPTDQYPAGSPNLDKPVTYPRGTLAMANAGPNTNGSQFFLVYKDSQLPPQYTVFGTIDETGLATLDKIGAEGTANGTPDGKPKTDVKIKSVRVD